MLGFMAIGQFFLWITSSQLETLEMDLCQAGEMVNFTGLVARVGIGDALTEIFGTLALAGFLGFAERS